MIQNGTPPLPYVYGLLLGVWPILSENSARLDPRPREHSRNPQAPRPPHRTAVGCTRKAAAADTTPLVIAGSPTGSRRRPATPNCSLGRSAGSPAFAPRPTEESHLE